jgi:RNase P subunit RPR2
VLTGTFLMKKSNVINNIIVNQIKEMVKMNCWYCGSDMHWNADFNYDEVFEEGEGVVSYLTCSECGATAQFSLRTDKEDED